MDAEEYTLEDIVDASALGPEPSLNYSESLDLIDNVVRECMFVSKSYSAIPAPTGRHFYASVLFTVMITRGVSLLTLAPLTPWAQKKIEHWDYASLAILVRTMIELRVAFHYLCAENCSDDEWDCRWNLLNLHDCSSRLRIAEVKEDESEIAILKEQAEELRDRLRSNAHFCSLDSKRHKKLLHGQTAYLFPLEEIAEKAGIDLKTFRTLYVVFSSHVHGLPMSFYRIAGDSPEQGRGLPSSIEENHSSLCLTLAATLLVYTRDELHHLFEGIERNAEEPLVAEQVIEEVTNLLQIGETASHDLTADLRAKFTRTSEDSFLVEYICRDTGEIVLERTESERVGVQLQYFDPLFWKFTINGRPATEGRLKSIEEKPYAFAIDHEKLVVKMLVEEADSIVIPTS
ncbi:hypothetical protein ACVITL_003111 [Rhizobium pisi]